VAPAVGKIPVRFLVAVMFMPRKKDDVVIFPKGVAFFVLRNIKRSLYADDDHKGVQVAAGMSKFFPIQKLAGRNMDKRIGIPAYKIPHV
jgi:hypothetical protein